MFLCLSTRGILRIQSHAGNSCFQKFFIFIISHIDICTGFSNWFDVITSWCNISIRTHCSAILDSRLLSVVHINGLCGLYFCVHVEIVGVVFGVSWGEFVLSIPTHQFLKMISHSLTKFGPCYHRHVQDRNLVVLCARSLQRGTTLRVHE